MNTIHVETAVDLLGVQKREMSTQVFVLSTLVDRSFAVKRQSPGTIHAKWPTMVFAFGCQLSKLRSLSSKVRGRLALAAFPALYIASFASQTTTSVSYLFIFVSGLFITTLRNPYGFGPPTKATGCDTPFVDK